MANEYRDGATSTASIARHPIHPMLIPFPLVCLSGTLVSDLIFWYTRDPFWARASIWLLAAGLVTGGLAAVFGLTDFLTIDRARARAAGWIHFLGNLAALVISLLNLLIRFQNPISAVVPAGVILSFFVAMILIVTGWMGGELVYRYKVGVASNETLRLEDERSQSERQPGRPRQRV